MDPSQTSPSQEVKRVSSYLLSLLHLLISVYFSLGHETRCWASTKDGLFFEWDIESQKILTELSGADFNAINGIAVHGDLAFAVEKQGILKYRLSE